MKNNSKEKRGSSVKFGKCVEDASGNVNGEKTNSLALSALVTKVSSWIAELPRVWIFHLRFRRAPCIFYAWCLPGCHLRWWIASQQRGQGWLLQIFLTYKFCKSLTQASFSSHFPVSCHLQFLARLQAFVSVHFKGEGFFFPLNWQAPLAHVCPIRWFKTIVCLFLPGTAKHRLINQPPVSLWLTQVSPESLLIDQGTKRQCDGFWKGQSSPALIPMHKCRSYTLLIFFSF